MTSTAAPAYPAPMTTQAAEHCPATRSTGDDAKAVASALKGEWVKATTVRTYRAILALTVVGGLVMSWLVAKFVTDKGLDVTEVGFFWTTVVSVLAAMCGILLFGSEVQHGTLAAAVTARPARWITALAKTLTAAGLGLLLGAVGIASGLTGAVSAGLGAGDTASIPATVGWALLFTSLSAVLGLGIGMIARHSAAAVGGLLVWGFVLEPLLNSFLPARVARFLPFVAGNHMLAYKSDIDAVKSMAVEMTRPENALIFGGYTALALIAGAVLLHRRDIN